jgi:hypothetical protein
MKLYSEFYTNEKALFKRADAILKENGLYDITRRSGGFIIEYGFTDCLRAYIVQKGREDGAFIFTIGKSRAPMNEITLIKGDALFMHYQRKRKTFFHCPKAIIGKRELGYFESSLGHTYYGTLSNMVDEGLLKRSISDASAYMGRKMAAWHGNA